VCARCVRLPRRLRVHGALRARLRVFIVIHRGVVWSRLWRICAGAAPLPAVCGCCGTTPCLMSPSPLCCVCLPLTMQVECSLFLVRKRRISWLAWPRSPSTMVVLRCRCVACDVSLLAVVTSPSASLAWSEVVSSYL
jgi:hypothetical protein